MGALSRVLSVRRIKLVPRSNLINVSCFRAHLKRKLGPPSLALLPLLRLAISQRLPATLFRLHNALLGREMHMNQKSKNGMLEDGNWLQSPLRRYKLSMEALGKPVTEYGSSSRSKRKGLNP